MKLREISYKILKVKEISRISRNSEKHFHLKNSELSLLKEKMRFLSKPQQINTNFDSGLSF